MTGTRHKAQGTRDGSGDLAGCFAYALCLVTCAFFLTGCATSAKKPGSSQDTPAEQVDAAQKVVGAMAGGREISQADLRRVAEDVRANEGSRTAVQKILGGGEAPAIKYSPATGKHYSGDLEYDPETGVKLEIIRD